MNSHDNMFCINFNNTGVIPGYFYFCLLMYDCRAYSFGTELANNLPLFPYQLVIVAVGTKHLFNSPVFPAVPWVGLVRESSPQFENRIIEIFY